MIQNDLYTGIVVDINMKIAVEKTQKVWTVYDSKEDAIKDAMTIVKEYDHIECMIFDKDRKLLQIILPDNYPIHPNDNRFQ